MANPRISIIMATYNRAHTINRAIDSLLSQSYEDWELIVVDDGSTDNTSSVLSGYSDPRIRVVKHETNKGVCAAKNTGFDNMTGEWFTTLDSDDEMTADALNAFIDIIDSNPSVDAITCNCVDSVSGEFTGNGLVTEGLVTFEDVLRCQGEHWGLTQSSLLGSRRFNERIAGGESTVWFSISTRATRYYTHKALRIYHTEGSDRICTKKKAIRLEKWISCQMGYAEETEYLDLLRQYQPQEHSLLNTNIALAYALDGKKTRAVRTLVCRPSFSKKYVLAWLVVLLGRRFGMKAISSRLA